MTGQTVAHYQILERLGAGGMGVVYKARDTHLDRFVAIKVLPAEKMSDPERKRRFTQEAKSASALNHPNIITIYDISSDGGRDFIAMEFVPGKTLDQLIGRDGMPVGVALKYAIQIGEALARAHSVGIVHRDLKPSNIMVDEHGHVKVLDFGLAKLTQPPDATSDESTILAKPATEEGVIIGTAAYMSPEQAQGLKVDARTDIFSFGAVLYEMLSGRRAFLGKTTLDTIAAILKNEPAPLDSDVPQDLEKVIARCLRKERERRSQHMGDVCLALQELKEASDTGKQAELRPAKQPRRVGIWAGAALVAALLAGGGWYFRAVVWQPRGLLVTVPLTSYPGFQMSPNFSPDGKQVVFGWNGEKQDNWDIYVKMIGSPTPLRLTTNPAKDFDPAFSPDGQSIGFMREAGGKASFIVIPALGGPERVVATNLAINNVFGSYGRTFDWLPDGKWIVTTGLELLSIESGDTRKLTTPVGPSLPDFSPAVAPDGRTIAFCRPLSAGTQELWLLELTDDLKPKAEPRRFTHLNLELGVPAWTPDGKGILFSAGPPWGNQSIWRVAASGSEPPERIPFGVEDASWPAVARNGNRLAFQRGRRDTNIYRLSFSDSGVPMGQPSQFLSSTRNEINPQYSPDGSRIAFESDRGGDYGVLVSDADGSNAVELVSSPGTVAGTPRWSPDGSKLTFDWNVGGNWDVYIVRSSGGKPVRLTSDPGDDVLPSWSRDGKWIYFASNRRGRNEIWKVPAGGGDAVLMTRNGGQVALESADGTSLYYKKDQDSTSLWNAPLGGGEERQVSSAVSFRSFFVAAKGLYFVTPKSPAGEFSIQFLDTATGKVNTIATISGVSSLGLSVSPDGKSILYSQSDSYGQDLMLVENFR